jgi:hypothetical protein
MNFKLELSMQLIKIFISNIIGFLLSMVLFVFTFVALGLAGGNRDTSVSEWVLFICFMFLHLFSNAFLLDKVNAKNSRTLLVSSIEIIVLYGIVACRYIFYWYW